MSGERDTKKSDPGEHSVTKDKWTVVHSVGGIEEADNDLPRWWLVTLFGTVLFAGIYWFNYQVFHFGMTTNAEYAVEADRYAAIEAARVKAAGVMTPEALLTLSRDPGTLTSGKDVFEKTCAPCHKPDGSGNVGPNLTDSYWIHGGSPDKVLATITNGVPDKGMPTWGPQLGVDSTRAVAAYVISLRNKNLPGKAPQGTLDP